jgi:hypothetical protein
MNAKLTRAKDVSTLTTALMGRVTIVPAQKRMGQSRFLERSVKMPAEETQHRYAEIPGAFC